MLLPTQTHGKHTTWGTRGQSWSLTGVAGSIQGTASLPWSLRTEYEGDRVKTDIYLLIWAKQNATNLKPIKMQMKVILPKVYFIM